MEERCTKKEEERIVALSHIEDVDLRVQTGEYTLQADVSGETDTRVSFETAT